MLKTTLGVLDDTGPTLWSPVRDEEAAGSNPVTPTHVFAGHRPAAWAFPMPVQAAKYSSTATQAAKYSSRSHRRLKPRSAHHHRPAAPRQQLDARSLPGRAAQAARLCPGLAQLHEPALAAKLALRSLAARSPTWPNTSPQHVFEHWLEDVSYLNHAVALDEDR